MAFYSERDTFPSDEEINDIFTKINDQEYNIGRVVTASDDEESGQSESSPLSCKHSRQLAAAHKINRKEKVAASRHGFEEQGLRNGFLGEDESDDEPIFLSISREGSRRENAPLVDVSQRSQDKKKGCSIMTWLIIIFAILLLMLIGVLILALVNKVNA